MAVTNISKYNSIHQRAAPTETVLLSSSTDYDHRLDFYYDHTTTDDVITACLFSRKGTKKISYDGMMAVARVV